MSILVTGASSGFGAAICETLINAGYRESAPPAV